MWEAGVCVMGVATSNPGAHGDSDLRCTVDPSASSCSLAWIPRITLAASLSADALLYSPISGDGADDGFDLG